MTLASYFSWADRFESYLVKKPKDSFLHDEAQLQLYLFSLVSQYGARLEGMKMHFAI